MIFFFFTFAQQLNLFSEKAVKDYFLLLFYVVFPVLKALSNSDYMGEGKGPQCAFLLNFVHRKSVDIVVCMFKEVRPSYFNVLLTYLHRSLYGKWVIVYFCEQDFL